MNEAQDAEFSEVERPSEKEPINIKVEEQP